MPKLKTNKTASKRIKKITSSGKVIRRKTLAQHLVKRKSSRTIEQSGQSMTISKPEAKKIKMLLPYK
jgi:large subunit ribosomal protein L35